MSWLRRMQHGHQSDLSAWASSPRLRHQGRVRRHQYL